MNLCPCGGRGDPAAECSCSAQRIAAYRDKLSRALLDRFDLLVHVPRARAAELNGSPGEPSSAVRKRVEAASMRLRDPPQLSETAAALLTRAVDSLPLSGRGRARVARVAGTIAALAGAERIGADHLAEALSYRSPAELGPGA
jgi:magnesium chelatase family protein